MKVAIIGSGAKERFFHPDDDTEVWGLNAIRPKWVKRWHRMFNLHLHANLEKYKWHLFDKEAEWSKEHPHVPFYTCDKWPERNKLAGQQIFPRGELESALSPRGADYHCGSFDWMVAFAIYCEATEINLHGISLCLEAGEPISSRACLEYWCGYAEGRGIKVTAAEDCDLFHFYHLVKSKLVYSYDDTPIFEDRTKPVGDPSYTWE
jgi:hypothetical protein